MRCGSSPASKERPHLGTPPRHLPYVYVQYMSCFLFAGNWLIVMAADPACRVRGTVGGGFDAGGSTGASPRRDPKAREVWPRRGENERQRLPHASRETTDREGQARASLHRTANPQQRWVPSYVFRTMKTILRLLPSPLITVKKLFRQHLLPTLAHHCLVRKKANSCGEEDLIVQKEMGHHCFRSSLSERGAPFAWIPCRCSPDGSGTLLNTT